MVWVRKPHFAIIRERVKHGSFPSRSAQITEREQVEVLGGRFRKVFSTKMTLKFLDRRGGLCYGATVPRDGGFP